jgi:hypothetical protein
VVVLAPCSLQMQEAWDGDPNSSPTIRIRQPAHQPHNHWRSLCREKNFTIALPTLGHHPSSLQWSVSCMGN